MAANLNRDLEATTQVSRQSEMLLGLAAITHNQGQSKDQLAIILVSNQHLRNLPVTTQDPTTLRKGRDQNLEALDLSNSLLLRHLWSKGSHLITQPQRNESARRPQRAEALTTVLLLKKRKKKRMSPSKMLLLRCLQLKPDL